MPSDPPADRSDVVERAVGGDRAALTELLERHGPHVLASLAGEIPLRWQSVLAREDVLQQTYTDAFLCIGQLESRNEVAFGAWLVRLARRNLLDALRMLEAEKRGGGRRRVDAADVAESCVMLYEMLGGSSNTASREAAMHEAEEKLKEKIEDLPEIYRQVIRMYDLEGRSVEEVSAALHRSEGAVFMLRARAHRRLAELMGTVSRYLSDSE